MSHFSTQKKNLLILVIFLLLISISGNVFAQTLNVPDQISTISNQTSTNKINTTPKINSNLPFPDVKKGNHNYTAIYYLANLGIINGYPNGTFKPNNPINRAEALKILTLAIPFQSFSGVEKPLNSSAEIITTKPKCPFPDLQKNSWYYPHICEAYNNGIITGYPDGTFKPEQTINRIEAIKIGVLQSGVNFMQTNYQLKNYNDTPENQWYTEFAKFAKSTSIYPEDTNNNLHPELTMNRGDFAGLVYRFLKFQKSGSEFGRASFYGPGLEGRGTASGDPFNASIMAAAHKTLPFGTKVKVTDLSNNKSVIVKINDRGPYVNGTIIDLTTAAFKTITSLGAGIFNAELEVLNTPNNAN